MVPRSSAQSGSVPRWRASAAKKARPGPVTQRPALGFAPAGISQWAEKVLTVVDRKTGKKIKDVPVGGVIRVVLVKETHSWFAYFCTKADAGVQEILEAVADRAAIEQILQRAQAGHYGVHTLISEIEQSPLFLHK